MITAIYPGTFDPITNGHSDIVARAANLFDKVIVAVAKSTSKTTAFTIDERVAMANEALDGLERIEVVSFDGLMTAFARECGAKVIVRGLRAVSDFENEFQMAGMNRHLNDTAETVFLKLPYTVRLHGRMVMKSSIPSEAMCYVMDAL